MNEYLSNQELLNELRKLDEGTLTQKFIIPLLEAMGFQMVRYTHGTFEFGKDVVFFKTTEFGDKEWYAAQVKAGAVDGSASGSASIRTICNQIPAKI